MSLQFPDAERQICGDLVGMIPGSELVGVRRLYCVPVVSKLLTHIGSLVQKALLVFKQFRNDSLGAQVTEAEGAADHVRERGREGLRGIISKEVNTLLDRPFIALQGVHLGEVSGASSSSVQDGLLGSFGAGGGRGVTIWV